MRFEPEIVQRACVILSSLLLLSWPSGLRAQVEVPRGLIAGNVRLKTDTTVAVTGAWVTMAGTRIRQSTDSAGRFRFAGVVPGRYELELKRVGYAPITKFVTVAPGESTAVVVDMDPAPQPLRAVVIAGRRTFFSPRFADPYRRASLGFGDYFTHDDIEQRSPFDTKSLLNGLPGVRVNERGVIFKRCADPGSKAQVYIDGVRVTRTMDVNSALLSVLPRNIEIMEVYRGIARIPGEFLEDACAVIAIWTKAY